MRDTIRATALVGGAFFCAAFAGVAMTTPLPVGIWPRLVAGLFGVLGFLWFVDLIGRAMINRIVIGSRR